MSAFKNKDFATIQRQPSGEGAQTPPEQPAPAVPRAPRHGQTQPPERPPVSDLLELGELL